jgi:hypothetical protein
LTFTVEGQLGGVNTDTKSNTPKGNTAKGKEEERVEDRVGFPLGLLERNAFSLQ